MTATAIEPHRDAHEVYNVSNRVFLMWAGAQDCTLMGGYVLVTLLPHTTLDTGLRLGMSPTLPTTSTSDRVKKVCFAQWMLVVHGA